jgi:hypothetical protein
VPLLVGLTGPSGSGKTKSALRLADGMRGVDGGKTFVIDTESNRALHYADEHTYEHVPFTAPFAPADYLACFKYCVDAGATVIVVDSTSHEWEGEGGVLDIQARVEGGNPKRSMVGWTAAKKEHGLFVRSMLQIPAHFILCFRAKPKLKIQPGKDPVPLGFMPIGGSDLIYELVVNALLLPGARGVPTWKPEERGEREIVKLPGWADRIFREGALDEQTGAELAKWAAGTKARSLAELLADLETVSDPATLGTLRTEARVMARSSKGDRETITKAVEAATTRLKTIEASHADEPVNEDAEPAD